MVSVSGFLYSTNKKLFFYETDSKNITKAVIFRFLDEIGKDCNVYYDQIFRIKSDIELQKVFKKGISRATLEKMSKNGVEWYRISGKGFQLNYPIENFNKIVVVFG